MIECLICGKELKILSYQHLIKHDITAQEYKTKFGVSTVAGEEYSASLSAATSGKNNPMYGRHQTEETKEKISCNKERAKKISNFMVEYRKSHSLSGEKNPMYGKHHSPESISKMSSTVCDQINNGRNLFANHKKGYFRSQRLNKEIWYDSSYELKTLEILEKDLSIADFGRSYLKVPYIYNNKQAFTVPDFKVIYVNSLIKIIEVKPERKIKLIEKERIKIEAINNYCSNNNYIFEVWIEENLM